MKKYAMFFLLGAFFSVFAQELSLTVISYVGKLEFATMEFGPWRTLNVEDTVPLQGFLRLSGENDSAELERSDGTLIRLVGKTLIPVSRLVEAPKPKKGLAGLFRKKKPLIEIQSEVAVAAVRGSVQGQGRTSLESGQSQTRGITIGLGGIFSSEKRGVLIETGYSNDFLDISVALPLVWGTNGFEDARWKTLDGWLALLQSVSIGNREDFFFVQWGEASFQFGEGALVEESIKRYNPYTWSENILQAQVNFGDVGVRVFFDKPSDGDRWGVETFIHPFWGSGSPFEATRIKAFIVNEDDASTPFFPGVFQVTNGEISYVTGYGISAFVPVVNVKEWTVALLGEIGGLNEKAGYMGGATFGYGRLFSLRGRFSWSKEGYVPWYFDSFYRYTRPLKQMLLGKRDFVGWALDGTLGEKKSLALQWGIKNRNGEWWTIESGFSLGQNLFPFTTVEFLFSTEGGLAGVSFDQLAEQSLALFRLNTHFDRFFVAFEYTQALQKWGKGWATMVVGARF
ncbi:hypothetical protein [Thermospira aquatica]|uniref:Capsule assembly Wzi family protein n=1 Tax=Thermospira aquatica TaxID=2828656 RepID=A0AAX3BEL5_9SPIR|nr:hypothetical protein [Thermospira aquatica]URA10777.1 hypothetical protein KDW03_02950 [Thermospira aquatica]